MASSFRTGGSAREAGEPFFLTRAGAVPVSATQQRDFRVRCDTNGRLWRNPHFMPPGCTVDGLINQRTQFSQYVDSCPDEWGLDVRFARNAREAAYAKQVARAVANPSWFEDKSHFDDRLVLSDVSLIARTGIPSDHQVDHYMPYAWRRWERASRHRFGVLVGVQHREIMAMRPNVVPTKYPPLPSYWDRFELPYGFNAQCPPIVTYFGLDMAWNPFDSASPSVVWKILFTEHAWTAAAELVHEARRGRLWWLPEELLIGMEAVGLSALCHDNASHVAELEGLIKEIRLIRWSRVPRSHGIVPRINKFSTPVFNSGDYVDFDSVAWCTWLKPELYLEHDHEYKPLEALDDRGESFFGKLPSGVPDPVPDWDMYVAPGFDYDENTVAEPLVENDAVGDNTTNVASDNPTPEVARSLDFDDVGAEGPAAAVAPLDDTLDAVDETLDISGLRVVYDRSPDGAITPMERDSNGEANEPQVAPAATVPIATAGPSTLGSRNILQESLPTSGIRNSVVDLTGTRARVVSGMPRPTPAPERHVASTVNATILPPTGRSPQVKEEMEIIDVDALFPDE